MSIIDSGVNSSDDGDRPRSSNSQDSLNQISIDQTLDNLNSLRDEMSLASPPLPPPPPPPPEFSDFVDYPEEDESMNNNSAMFDTFYDPPSHLELIQQATMRRSIRRKPEDSIVTEKSLTERLRSFHVNENSEIGEISVNSSYGGFNEDDEDWFAGIKNPLQSTASSSAASTIRSKRGTVRGVRNRVRQGIATFLRDPSKKVSAHYMYIRINLRDKCSTHARGKLTDISVTGSICDAKCILLPCEPAREGGGGDFLLGKRTGLCESQIPNSRISRGIVLFGIVFRKQTSE